MANLKSKFNKHNYLRNNLINIAKSYIHKSDRRQQTKSGENDLINIYIYFFSSFNIGFLRSYD